MSISLADLNWPAWPLWRNFMGLKAFDPAVVETDGDPAGASSAFSSFQCFLILSRASFFASERLVRCRERQLSNCAARDRAAELHHAKALRHLRCEACERAILAASAAYLRSERRTAACNSRSTNEQMLAETRPHSE
jgi:hypothetical protein